jgi:hypothetical protein
VDADMDLETDTNAEPDTETETETETEAETDYAVTLLMDNHGSYLTYKFLQFYDHHHIIAYYFIPHTIHICQPLDSQPFQVLKDYYKKNNNTVVSPPGRNLLAMGTFLFGFSGRG